MAKSGWLAGLLVGLAIGLSWLTGVAVGAWWATPAPQPTVAQVTLPGKFLPSAPAATNHRVHAPLIHAPVVID
jgi:hypothetical protein